MVTYELELHGGFRQLREMIQELVSDKKKLESALRDQYEAIKELEKHLKEKDADKEQLETTLHGQIKELVNKVREKDSDMATSDCYREKMEATNSDKKEVDSAVCGKMKKLVAVGAGCWFFL